MPRPDLESIQDIVRAADPEGLLAEGAPEDEYEPEEEALLEELLTLSTSELTEERVRALLDEVWSAAFVSAETPERDAGLQAIAERIVHYFGPQSSY
jgi:hypothetical protein